MAWNHHASQKKLPKWNTNPGGYIVVLALNLNELQSLPIQLLPRAQGRDLHESERAVSVSSNLHFRVSHSQSSSRPIVIKKQLLYEFSEIHKRVRVIQNVAIIGRAYEITKHQKLRDPRASTIFIDSVTRLSRLWGHRLTVHMKGWK